MFFKIFSLHPDIFSSFFSQSLISKAHKNQIFDYKIINWRDKHGKGNYKQVDDRPFGGGQGMVLTAEPIYQSLKEEDCLSGLYEDNKSIVRYPNNPKFYRKWKESLETKNPIKKITISLTPKGYSYNQKTAEWLSNFEEVSLLCGRYDGFDSRLENFIDLEISVGDFVVNGGEIPSMLILESLVRLLPGFTKNSNSISHDSFSVEVNKHSEQIEYIVGKEKLKKIQTQEDLLKVIPDQIFDEKDWIENKMPKIEHPQFTKPLEWMGIKVPEILLSGHHEKIQKWRETWYKN